LDERWKEETNSRFLFMKSTSRKRRRRKNGALLRRQEPMKPWTIIALDSIGLFFEEIERRKTFRYRIQSLFLSLIMIESWKIKTVYLWDQIPLLFINWSQRPFSFSDEFILQPQHLYFIREKIWWKVLRIANGWMKKIIWKSSNERESSIIMKRISRRIKIWKRLPSHTDSFLIINEWLSVINVFTREWWTRVLKIEVLVSYNKMNEKKRLTSIWLIFPFLVYRRPIR